MTGQEAKQLRKEYGFTLSEASNLLGFNNRMNINKIENLEIVSIRYEKALLNLVRTCELQKEFLKLFLIGVDQQHYVIISKRKRVKAVLVKDESRAAKLAEVFNSTYQLSVMEMFKIKIL